MCRLSWFLDPGGWSKTAAVGLYFIFPGICTLSLDMEKAAHIDLEGPLLPLSHLGPGCILAAQYQVLVFLTSDLAHLDRLARHCF
ncbi:hypothetical protein STEG23_013276, partial [Scotinomys teguina]